MMKAVQVVLDDALLQATDEALLRTKQNRSEFVRDALRERLARLAVLEGKALVAVRRDESPGHTASRWCLR